MKQVRGDGAGSQAQLTVVEPQVPGDGGVVLASLGPLGLRQPALEEAGRLCHVAAIISPKP